MLRTSPDSFIPTQCWGPLEAELQRGSVATALGKTAWWACHATQQWEQSDLSQLSVRMDKHLSSPNLQRPKGWAERQDQSLLRSLSHWWELLVNSRK